MRSRWESHKGKAAQLRKEGCSIREIESLLHIPRSTLSGWLRTVPLTKRIKASLMKRQERSLELARKKAAEWHTKQKILRVAEIKRRSQELVGTLPKHKKILELALAMLYLGEGSKTNSQTTLSSSNPSIARFFIFCLRKLYKIPIGEIRCYLHLRSDQNSTTMLRFWRQELQLPKRNFGKPLIDRRAVKSPR